MGTTRKQSSVLTWFSLASDASVIKRSLLYALVVGAILIAINHGDKIWAGEVGTTEFVKMAVTILVPYAVSTLSSVGAMITIRNTRRHER